MQRCKICAKTTIFLGKFNLELSKKLDIQFCLTYPLTYIRFYPIFANLPTYPKIGYPFWTPPKYLKTESYYSRGAIELVLKWEFGLWRIATRSKGLCHLNNTVTSEVKRCSKADERRPRSKRKATKWEQQNITNMSQFIDHAQITLTAQSIGSLWTGGPWMDGWMDDTEPSKKLGVLLWVLLY